MTFACFFRSFLLLSLFFLLPLTLPVQAGDQNKDAPFQTFQSVNLNDPHEEFEDIQSRIRNVTNFHATFTEEKDLNALSRTIKNEGFVIFARNRGLYRAVEKPFETRQLVTKDGLVIEDTAEGTRRKQLKPGSPPRQFLDSLYMVFSGNFSKFKQRFRVELKIKHSDEKNRNDRNWVLRLYPNDKKMKQFFSRMQITGTGKQLNSFRLHKDNGDTTHTTFSNQSYPDQLTEEQIDRFRSLRKK